jgi:tetratricopeptide (TPR) repeat protein
MSMQQRAIIKRIPFIVTSRFVELSVSQRDMVCARLLACGQTAITLRDREALSEIGELLKSLPLSNSITAIGHYYAGLSNPDIALRSFEHVLSVGSPVYKARAILSLGAVAARNNDTQNEVELYASAIQKARAAQDVYTAIHAHKMLAIRRAVEGNHQRVIDDLYTLFPLVRLIARHDLATYHDYLNSLAVELAEVGMLDEAEKAIKIVTASPLLSVNPEWQQTAQEIQQAQARPLIIAVPEIEESAEETRPAIIRTQPARQALENLIALTLIPNSSKPRAPPMLIL